MIQIIERPSSDFFPGPTAKNLFIHHFTAGGTLAGSETTLANPDKVNVCYQGDRDGTIYKYFEERFYAYATGKGKGIDSRAIQVEWVCWGPLKRKGNACYAWPNNWSRKVPWSEVIRLPMWRGFEYWHILTPQQEESARWITADVLSRWNGMDVTTHAYFRSDKFDFPPTYPVIKDLITLKYA